MFESTLKVIGLHTLSNGQYGRVVRLTLKVAEVGGTCPCETQPLE